MRNSGSLSALLVSCVLTFAPVTGFADPASPATPATATTPAEIAIARASAPAPSTTAASDSEQYASREAGDQSVAEFQGGDSVTIVGSTLAIVLLVVLVVILL
jgi:hypothetical protein